MRILYPESGSTDIDSEVADYRPFEMAPEDRPYVAVNMVTSLDGRASIKGKSSGLGSKRDSELLLKLRTRFDAVLIGAGTMRAERYGRIVPDADARNRRQEEGLNPDPLAVIISSNLDLPFDAKLFTSGAGKVLIFSMTEGPIPETETKVEVVEIPDVISIALVLENLRGRGVNSVLCEGGPHVLAQLEEADAVDELFLTTSPVIAGGNAPRILEGKINQSRDLKLHRLLEDDGELFARYLR